DSPVDIKEMGQKDIPIAGVNLLGEHVSECRGIGMAQGKTLYDNDPGLHCLENTFSHGIFRMMICFAYIHFAQSHAYRGLEVFPGSWSVAVQDIASVKVVEFAIRYPDSRAAKVLFGILPFCQLVDRGKIVSGIGRR